MNRSQINSCSFAASYFTAALFNAKADNNIDFHGFSAATTDKWPTLLMPSNELFEDGYVIDLLPNDEAQNDESIVPTSLTVQACSCCGHCVEKTVEVHMDHKTTVERLQKAFFDVIETMAIDKSLCA